MLAVDSFFSRVGLGQFGFRWLHILAGITWIGLLYYFNFVQVPAFADYMGEAFKPLGVYINFFQPTVKPGVSRASPL